MLLPHLIVTLSLTHVSSALPFHLPRIHLIWLFISLSFPLPFFLFFYFFYFYFFISWPTLHLPLFFPLPPSFLSLHLPLLIFHFFFPFPLNAVSSTTSIQYFIHAFFFFFSISCHPNLLLSLDFSSPHQVQTATVFFFWTSPLNLHYSYSPLCNALAAHHNSHRFKLFNHLLLCLINSGVSNLCDYSMWCLGRYTPTPSHLPLYIDDETWFPLPTQRFRRYRLPHLLHVPYLQGPVHSAFLLTTQCDEWDQIQELSNTGDISKFQMISVIGIFSKKDFSLYVFGFSIPPQCVWRNAWAKVLVTNIIFVLDEWMYFCIAFFFFFSTYFLLFINVFVRQII